MTKYVKVKWGKDRSIFESDSVVGNMHHIIHYNISKYIIILILVTYCISLSGVGKVVVTNKSRPTIMVNIHKHIMKSALKPTISVKLDCSTSAFK